ncbi:hypothetical protein OsI_35839 [Oryza sativa Indica Group]|uniref:Uncharacterized protein n=1 Tax=Oryza sativa subsp. indica TaxID=39946 RepID=B8BK41_ORYSI|nr:hypothetical protein OsI_35839 [Oryza sativa Indica Group]
MHFNGAVTAITSFPQVLLTAAAFDDRLWFRIGQLACKHDEAIYMDLDLVLAIHRLNDLVMHAGCHTSFFK